MHVTTVVLAAGDPKPDGEKYTVEEVAALQRLWAGRYASGTDRYLYEGGTKNFNVHVIGYGMTDEKPLSLMGADGKMVPKRSWFVQLEITDGKTGDKKTHHPASRAVGNKKVLNGVSVMGPAILMKGDADHDSPFLDSIEEVPVETIDIEDLGTEIGSLVCDALIESGQDDRIHQVPAMLSDAFDTATTGDELDAEKLGQCIGAFISGDTEYISDMTALGKSIAVAALDALCEAVD